MILRKFFFLEQLLKVQRKCLKYERSGDLESTDYDAARKRSEPRRFIDEQKNNIFELSEIAEDELLESAFGKTDKTKYVVSSPCISIFNLDELPQCSSASTSNLKPSLNAAKDNCHCQHVESNYLYSISLVN
jgi:hypothetical protein